MSGALALFAKTAPLTPVKTRLAADIGREAAETLYRLSVSALREVVQAVCSQVGADLVPYWALAEEEALDLPQWRDFAILWTGPGDLGRRLDSVYRRLLDNHEYVILIGTDSPQLTPALLFRVAGMIRQKPQSCIIGPARDGGFYLFAGGVPLPEEIWTQVTYSHSSTLKKLCNNLSAQGVDSERLKVRTDIDRAADIWPLVAALKANRERLPAQQALYQWLTERLI